MLETIINNLSANERKVLFAIAVNDFIYCSRFRERKTLSALGVTSIELDTILKSFIKKDFIAHSAYGWEPVYFVFPLGFTIALALIKEADFRQAKRVFPQNTDAERYSTASRFLFESAFKCKINGTLPRTFPTEHFVLDSYVNLTRVRMPFVFHFLKFTEFIRCQPQQVFELMKTEFLDKTQFKEPDDYGRYILDTLVNCAPAPFSIEASDWSLFHNQFLKSGQPESLLEKMHPGTEPSLILQAVIALSKNENQLAFDHMTKALGLVKSRRVFDVLIYNYFYGLVLYRNKKHAPAAKKIQYIAGLKSIYRETTAPLLAFCLLALDTEPEKIVAALKDRVEYLGKLGLSVVDLILRKYHIIDRIPDEHKEYGTYRYFLLEYRGLDHLKDTGTKNLMKEFGFRPLMLCERIKPEWERSLERLLIDLQPQAGVQGPVTASVRIAYVIDPEVKHLETYLQKFSSTGKWTKGRELSKVKWMAQSEGMTDQDLRLVRLHEQRDEWYSDDYFCSAMAVLQGHPYLFDRHGNPVEILRSDLQLSVIKEDDGSFMVQTNVNQSNKRYFSKNAVLDYTNPHRLVIYPLLPSQVTLLDAIKKINRFPPQAEELLTKLSGVLSKSMTVLSDVNPMGETVEKVSGDPRIALQISPDQSSSFRIALYVRPVQSLDLLLHPGVGQKTVISSLNGKPICIQRDLEKEKKALDALLDLTEEYVYFDEQEFIGGAELEDCLSLLSVLSERKDIAVVEWPQGVKYRVKYPRVNSSALSLSLKGLNSWFAIKGEIKLDATTTMDLAELLSRLRQSSGNFVQLSDDEYLVLSTTMRKQLETLDHVITPEHKTQKVPFFHALTLQTIADEGSDIVDDGSFQAVVDKIEESNALLVQSPQGLNGTLRDYQFDGYQWMMRLANWGAGAFLADDMGLGKTVQTIAVLLARASKGPAIVIVPTSVLLNWKDELNRFAPGLNARIFHLSKRTEILESLKAEDVLLTTYGVMTSECERLSAIDWSTAVLDEAHTIKNRDTKMSKAVQELKAQFRILLTGTPVQNHLGELWNLFEFANPGLLGTFSHFQESFINPITHNHDKTRQDQLKRLISPFILRRTKEDVLKELPQKTELTIQVELSQAERALYESIRELIVANIENGTSNTMAALAGLTKLRQAACHPALIDPKLTIESSKSRVFMELVEELCANGHRALVFSQFTSHLALIEKLLQEAGIDYVYLDGSITPAMRIKRVEQFQKGKMPLFLISLKAGGTGLNLTAADYVIHLDPWWNPAIEDQASDRAHRIGQQHPVTIYRLISTKTVEEGIIELHKTKKSLADALLEGTDVSHQLNREEILKLIELSS